MTLGAYLSVRRLSFLTVHLQDRKGQCLQGDEQAIQLSRGQLEFAHSCSCKNSATLRSFVSLIPSLVFDVLKSSIIALLSDSSLAGVWLEAITKPAADKPGQDLLVCCERVFFTRRPGLIDKSSTLPGWTGSEYFGCSRLAGVGCVGRFQAV